MTYKYFISYTFKLNNGSGGVGICEFDVSRKISSLSDVKEIQENIKKQKESAGMDIQGVIINNFILMDTVE